MLSVDNGNFSVKVSDDKLLLRGSGYAEGDLPELPSIKNDEATITGDRDGIHVVGGTYRSHWGGTPF
jgi:hypothetical protein